MKIKRRRLLSSPTFLLGTILALVGSIISFSHGLAEFNQRKEGYFQGTISFGDSTTHKMRTAEVEVKKASERGSQNITIIVTDDKTAESVYVKLYNVNDKGTFFIPGNNAQKNVGNLVKNINRYRDINNFYQTILPNEEGLQNGVGRVNITKLTDDEVEGELIIVANNAAGEQAQLSSARFKANIR